MSRGSVGVKLIVIGVVLIGILAYLARHDSFASPVVFYQQAPRYAIQVNGIGFSEEQTTIILRIIDQELDNVTEKQWSKFDNTPITYNNAVLYVGEKRNETKHLLAVPGRETLKKHWRYGSYQPTEDFLFLAFEPIPNPERENVFHLQFLDFPDLRIESKAPSVAYIPVLRSLPAYQLLPLGVGLSAVGFGILVWSAFGKKGEEKVVAEIKPTNEQPQPLSEDEEKMSKARERSRLDTEFETVLRLAKLLNTVEAIQQWEKEQRRDVLSNLALTIEEKEERLAQIDKAAARERKRLEDDVTVYE